MRTIKFRGYVPTYLGMKGYWVYGLLVRYNDELATIVSNDKLYSVPSNTIGQFTGLLDKNGVEIYEGDNIILHQFLFDGGEYENQLIGRVIYDNNQSCYCLTNIKNEQVQEYMGYKDDYTNFQKETVPINLFYGMHEESFEVIGNIHEEVEE